MGLAKLTTCVFYFAAIEAKAETVATIVSQVPFAAYYVKTKPAGK